MLTLEAMQLSRTTWTLASTDGRETCAFSTSANLAATSVAMRAVCLSRVPAASLLTVGGPSAGTVPMVGGQASASAARTTLAASWRRNAMAAAMAAKLNGTQARSLAFGGTEPKPYHTERTSSPPDRRRD